MVQTLAHQRRDMGDKSKHARKKRVAPERRARPGPLMQCPRGKALSSGVVRDPNELIRLAATRQTPRRRQRPRCPDHPARQRLPS